MTQIDYRLWDEVSEHIAGVIYTGLWQYVTPDRRVHNDIALVVRNRFDSWRLAISGLEIEAPTWIGPSEWFDLLGTSQFVYPPWSSGGPAERDARLGIEEIRES